MLLATADRRGFPPNTVITIKALACELPHDLGIPLSRFSMTELKRAAIERGDCGLHWGNHDLALAVPGRHQAVEPLELDFSP